MQCWHARQEHKGSHGQERTRGEQEEGDAGGFPGRPSKLLRINAKFLPRQGVQSLIGVSHHLRSDLACRLWAQPLGLVDQGEFFLFFLRYCRNLTRFNGNLIADRALGSSVRRATPPSPWNRLQRAYQPAR